MRFLIIGSDGFIGSNLFTELKNNHTVIGLDYNDIDIRYPEDWGAKYNNSFFNSFDYIYYLTAISDIEKCNNSIIDAFDVNVNGMIYILERIKNSNAIFIFSSSIYVYNNSSGVYGITKRTAEAIIKWYSDSYGLNYRILRYGSVYGYGSGAIYKMIRSALLHGVISYYGTGEEIREYIHVKDVVNASLGVLNNKYKNSTLTLAGHYPMKAIDLCNMINEILGGKYKIEFRGETPEGHYKTTPYSYSPDISKKYISKTFYDLGSGLLDLINKIGKEI